MNFPEFKKYIDELLLPMFPGASLGKKVVSTPRQQTVAFHGPCILFIKPRTDSNYRIALKRSQQFSKQEKRLVEIFVEEISNAHEVQDDFRMDVIAGLPRRLISSYLLDDSNMGRQTLEKSLLQFEELAAQTYEGRPVVTALGITGSMNHGVTTAEDLWKEDFSRVLSNGFDSIYVCGRDGKIFNVEYLPFPERSFHAPFRLHPIAKWTEKKNRVAIVLNRNSEILLFKRGDLQFARRRGTWIFYPHDSIIKGMGQSRIEIREAIYQSCIDTSFSRSGGCIAWLDKGKESAIIGTIRDFDLISKKQITRTKLLKKTINQKFHHLDRRLRQELIAMDGATVIDHQGNIIAAGSIIKVTGGSEGGGRRAAATQLSKFGLGIKISADGPITGLKNKKISFEL